MTVGFKLRNSSLVLSLMCEFPLPIFHLKFLTIFLYQFNREMQPLSGGLLGLNYVRFKLVYFQSYISILGFFGFSGKKPSFGRYLLFRD